MKQKMILWILFIKFADAVNKATEESIGLRKRKNVNGLSKEAIDLCEKRTRLRKEILASSICDEVKQKYSVVNKQVKKKFVVPRKKNLRAT